MNKTSHSWSWTLLLVLGSLLVVGVGCSITTLNGSDDSIVTQEETAIPELSEQGSGDALLAVTFDVEVAMDHIEALALDIGVRVAGSTEETAAAEYIRGKLVGMGLAPVIETFPVDGGRTSRNVVVDIASTSEMTRYMILGAHIDSKSPAPGANDNASGIGVLLELARMWAAVPPPIDLQLVFYGAEEIVDSDPDHHHYGSRAHAAALPASRDLIGMVSVDDVGVGPDLHARSMSRGPATLYKQFLAVADDIGLKATHKSGPGYSDHEPYEVKGYPVAWLQYRLSPDGHTPRDTIDKIDRNRLVSVSRWITAYFDGLSAEMINYLAGNSP